MHKTLEAYPVPKSLHDKHPKKISPIFRDVTELSAHHSLSEKIKDAVLGSRFLIVLCSPASKQSHWVNEEIKLFRKLHGEGSILCALIEGTPETSFPPALLAGGREPLAANLTPKNLRLGTSQLAASILGVGLDSLIQRDVRRRRNRMRAMMAGSFIFAAIMGGMAWTAMDARDEAELSRAEAEKMVEYIITDLDDELAPVGKLDVVTKVGGQVLTYYQAIPMADMDDDRLARRARAQQILAHVEIAQGNSQKALKDLGQVEKLTAEILRRRPDDPDAIFTHAQSQYALLRVYHSDDPQLALTYAQVYKRLSQRLYEMDKDNLDFVIEYGWASNKLGQIYRKLGDYDEAEAQFVEAASTHEQAVPRFPKNKYIEFLLTRYRRNLALIEYRRGNFEKAIHDLKVQMMATDELLLGDAENFEYLDSRLFTNNWVQYIQINNLKKCEPSEIRTLSEKLEARINHDPSDQRATTWYISLAYNALQNCSATFEQSWTKKTLNKVGEVYPLILQKTEKIEKKKVWLDNYQAKQFP